MINNSNLHVGHRKRLKAKFMKAPIRTFPDYEILEMLLFNCYPRKDTKQIAKDLLIRFGSLKALLSADELRLKEVGVESSSLIYNFKLLQDIFSRLYIAADEQLNVLSNWNAVLNYCSLTMGYIEREVFRILYLNKKNVLIYDEVMQVGTIDRVIVFPREIAKRCLTYSATAVILVHNHPSGEATPSPEDIEITHNITAALKPLNITVHDHLIIAKDSSFSLKKSGLI